MLNFSYRPIWSISVKGGIHIHPTFENLEPKKQKRILTAAYREFAAQGYEKASTNSIVKEAGIGKGMLFYYFKSKQDLYHYLIDYGIDFVTRVYLSKLDEGESDFIKKYQQAAQVKMEAYTSNPEIFNFFGTLYVNKETELTPELEARLITVRNLGFRKLFSNIDTSLFRDDVPSEKIYKLIHWTIEGIEKEIIASLKGKELSSVDMDSYWVDFYDYLALLRKILYK